MTRITTLICIRSLYPHFLFKRGSIVHCLFMVCLILLLGASLFGMYSVFKLLLDTYAVPFSSALSCGGSAIGLWVMIMGIRYGVTYA